VDYRHGCRGLELALAPALASKDWPYYWAAAGLLLVAVGRHGWRPSAPSRHSREVNVVIVRIFRPTIHPGKEEEFEAFLRDTAIPLVSQQSGLVAQHVGKPRDPSSTEFVYVTVWEDAESIRRFAGERWEEAVITPEEEHLLKDTWIGHYEVLPTSL